MSNLGFIGNPSACASHTSPPLLSLKRNTVSHVFRVNRVSLRKRSSRLSTNVLAASAGGKLQPTSQYMGRILLSLHNKGTNTLIS